jgi:DNA-binding response OmpR family regulator
VKKIRADVPVIMITAFGDADTRRKTLENGASDLLTKPRRHMLVEGVSFDPSRDIGPGRTAVQ